VAGQFGPH
jgi:transposase